VNVIDETIRFLRADVAVKSPAGSPLSDVQSQPEDPQLADR
jgi:hypothetical protein